MVQSTSRSSVILAVFFASGATSLVYQVLWTRWFGLVFGNTTISVTLVLGAFMCGLALGSAIVARRVATMARPLRAYAWCEAGIGAFALAFPLLLRAVESIYLLVDSGQGGVVTQVTKLVLAFALLCIPTGLMGATLPLLAEHFRRHPQDRASWGVGMLYAANTIGAASGIVLSGFVLIEVLGVTKTTLVAAAGNLVVAMIAVLVDSRRAAATETTPAAPAPPSAEARRQAMWVGAVLAVTGALALANEVLWTRLLSTFLGTSTYAFTTIVFTYLVGIAGGSAIMSRLMGRVRDPRGALLAAVVVAGIVHTISIEAFLYVATVGDLTRGSSVPLLDVLGLYLKFSLFLLPTAIASGACFPLATRILNPDDNDAEGALVARAYSANTWGSVVGSLVAGFVIAAWLDFEPSLRVVGMGYFMAALIGAVALRSSSQVAVPIGVVLVVVTVGSGARWLTRPDFTERFEQLTGNKVLRHQPGSQGLTTVTEFKDGTRTLSVNHHGMTMKLTDTKMMAHLPLFLIDEPADTLVICFGMGTTFRAAMSHGGNVTVVELVGGVADSFELFYKDAARLRAEPRGRILVDDGRHFLMATPQRFDVITLDPPPPIDGEGVNNLYSTDFAALARDHLKPGGIVAHWMPSIGTGSGVDDEETLQMIMQSFAAAFPYTMQIVGRNHVGFHMLGSLTPIVLDEAAILARMQARPAAVADMNELQRVRPSMLWSAEPYAVIEGAERTTDDMPLLEFSLLRGFKNMNGKVLDAHLWF